VKRRVTLSPRLVAGFFGGVALSFRALRRTLVPDAALADFADAAVWTPFFAIFAKIPKSVFAISASE